jgi:hypothetical protein
MFFKTKIRDFGARQDAGCGCRTEPGYDTALRNIKNWIDLLDPVFRILYPSYTPEGEPPPQTTTYCGLRSLNPSLTALEYALRAVLQE